MDLESGKKKLLYKGDAAIQEAQMINDRQLSLLTKTEALLFDLRRKKILRRFAIAAYDPEGKPTDLPLPLAKKTGDVIGDMGLTSLYQWMSPNGSELIQKFDIDDIDGFGVFIIRKWNIHTGQLIRERLTGDYYWYTFFSPSDNYEVYRTKDEMEGMTGEFGYLFLTSLRDKAEVVLPGKKPFSRAEISRQGRKLSITKTTNAYVTGINEEQQIWQLNGINMLAVTDVPSRGDINFTRHEHITFWEGAWNNRTLLWWNHETGDTLWKISGFTVGGEWYEIDIPNDIDKAENQLIVAPPGVEGYPGPLLLWQRNSMGPPAWQAKAHPAGAEWVHFLKQAGRIVSYSDGRIKGWQPPRQQPIFEIPLPGIGPALFWENPATGQIILGRAIPDSQHLEMNLYELNPQSGQLKLSKKLGLSPLKPLKEHKWEWLEIEITANGKFLLVNNKPSRQAFIWELASGKLISKFLDLDGHFIGLSPDGHFAYILRPHAIEAIGLSKDSLSFTFIPLENGDWAAITPSGLFDASPGAMDRMYFTLGLETIELEQLKERYYEPGLVEKILGFSDDPVRTVEEFSQIALYPDVTLQLDSVHHLLHIQLHPRNGGIGKASVFINGKEIIEDANPPQGLEKKRANVLAPVELEQYSRYFFQDSLNWLTVRAYNEAGWLKSPAHEVAYRPSFARTKGNSNTDSPALPSFQPVRDPALYAILVGTAKYAGSSLNLKYPGKDAQAMARALQQAGTQLFDDRVYIRLFTTDAAEVDMQPTKANIRKAFEEFEERANAEDILLVYFSGHGVTYGDADKAQFYYLTKDIRSENLSDAGIRRNRAISSAELTKWINDIPAQKQVMILDACNSGKILEALPSGVKNLNSTQIRAFDRMKDRTGMFVLAGSAADKASYEANRYGQGLLTFSLLEGMSGSALSEDSYLDVMALFQHARNKVPKLAESIGGIQKPMMAFPGGGASFDIGIVNDQVEIPLPEDKPIFVHNNFQEEESFADLLDIEGRLKAHLQEITTKGTKAGLIYIDVPEHQDAYSIKGRYRLEDVPEE